LYKISLLKVNIETQILKTKWQKPYTRIVVLYIAIIAGALPVMYLGSPVYLLVVLIFLKIIIDLYLHNKEHKIFQIKQISTGDN